MIGRFTSVALLLALAGCSPLRALNGLIPATGFAESTAIPYGPLPRQKLDVYRPRGAEGLRPTVVFFYGGTWNRGERQLYRFVGQALTSRGFVVVIPDYRLYPEVTFPAFVEDGARAVRWTRENVRRFGGDPERIFLMGHSAGAHIAALLTLDERYLREVGLATRTIRGTVGIAGPYDFLPFTRADVRAAMGPPEQWPATQPIRFVDGTEPPMLLLQGTGDKTVKPGNTTRLAARIREAGGCVSVREYPRVGHTGIVLALWSPFRRIAPTLRDAARWMSGPDECGRDSAVPERGR